MKKAIRKDFFVEIRKSLNRFLSIFFIVALGVAFFSGVRSSGPDMELSADRYYDESQLMDLRILSTLGVTEDDLAALMQVDKVKAAEGAYSVELYCGAPDKELTAKILSVTEKINLFTVTQGRMPRQLDECVVDEKLFTRYGFSLGDTISLRPPLGAVVRDYLLRDRFTIVGAVITPWYLSEERGTTGIGNGSLDCFVAVTAEAFEMEAYTELYVRVEGAAALPSYSAAYDDWVAAVALDIEDNLADKRCQIRYDEVVKEAQNTLDEARQEYETAKREADNKLEAAAKQIEEAGISLEDGWIQVREADEDMGSGRRRLLSSRKELLEGEKELADRERELTAAKSLLAVGEQEWESNSALLKKQERQLLDAKRELETVLPVRELELTEGFREYNKGRAAYEAEQKKFDKGQLALKQGFLDYEAGAQALLPGLKQALWELKLSGVPITMTPEQIERLTLEQFDLEANQGFLLLIPQKGQELVENITRLQITLAYLKEQQAVLDAGKVELTAALGVLTDSRRKLLEGEEQLAEAKQQIREGLSAIAEGKAALEEGGVQLSQARQEITDGEQLLAKGKEELADGRAQLSLGRQKISSGSYQVAATKKELSSAEQKLAEAMEDYEKALEEVDVELGDAQDTLQDAQHEIDDLQLPKWYVLDRNTIQAYVEFGQDAQRIGNIGEVFPAIFFLVAALVSLTTMTRMVEEQRTQIGTLKALGYGDAAIAGKYVCYALIASLAGSLAGVAVGGKVLPYVIMSAYGILYVNLRNYLIPLQLEYAVTSTLLAVCCTVAATVMASYKELLAHPAVLMRPVAPKQGKRVLLEYITPLWRQLSFTQKATVRNLLRYKKRFFMTVFGIGGCMALLLVGFGLRDSIYAIGEKQYDELWVYDVVIGVDTESKPEELKQLNQALDEDVNVLKKMEALQQITDIRVGDTMKSAYLFVPKEREQMDDFVKLRNRETRELYHLDESGAVITEKLAALLGVETGDEIEIKEEEGKWYRVKITAVAENYLQHYVYMSPDYYRELYGQDLTCQSVFMNLDKLDTQVEDTFGKEILSQPAVKSVTFIGAYQKQIDDMLGSLDVIIWVLIVSAGLLAFVVLYNLNNINITERKRELATLKVLGFFDLEVAQYVYRENMILTFLGSVAGVFLGIVLHRFVILTAEVDMLMFGRQMKTVSYLYSAALTWLFSGFVNFVMYYKLKKIDMVESLKSVE